MDFQIIVVGLIITFAASYFGLMIWRKGRSFTKPDNNCGNDCGCDPKTNLLHISKN